MVVHANQTQKYTLVAIEEDTKSIMSLLQGISDHPNAALLSFGLLPPLSMYAVESYRAINALGYLAPNQLEKFTHILTPIRHRAKLLDSTDKSVEQIAFDLSEFAERQSRLFVDSHTGFLSFLKKALQPDLGLYTINGHIFTTTHSIVFNFGQDSNLSQTAFDIGKALGSYTREMCTLYGIKLADLAPASPILLGAFEMRDIKSKALYRRGPLGTTPPEIAVGLIYLLANLNNMRLILHSLLPSNGHTQFRLKFIVAFHADSNLRSIQNRLASTSLLPKDAADIMKDVLGNPDSRWLRKQTGLRNMLVHYLADQRFTRALSPNSDWTQVIEHLGGGKSYLQISALLDRHLERMSISLEEGFSINGDPFWYGRVV